MSTRRAAAALAALQLLGCAPNLDWREVRVAGAGLSVLFPCRPSVQSRMVDLGSGPLKLELRLCSVGPVTWGLATADAADPARVGPLLSALSAAARHNLGAADSPGTAAAVPGSTPNPNALRHRFEGRLPDGRALSEQVVVFAKGTRVFQATVLGPQLRPEDADAFFESLRVGP